MEKREIRGKTVYIFEHHNIALTAWADVKTTHDEELILLTLDHHTDTHEAFIGWAYYTNGHNTDNVEPIIEERLARVDWRDDQSLNEAVNDLRNDEQIDAAIRLGLFTFAFCFNNQHTNTRSIEQEQFSNNWTF